MKAFLQGDGPTEKSPASRKPFEFMFDKNKTKKASSLNLFENICK